MNKENSEQGVQVEPMEWDIVCGQVECLRNGDEDKEQEKNSDKISRSSDCRAQEITILGVVEPHVQEKLGIEVVNQHTPEEEMVYKTAGQKKLAKNINHIGKDLQGKYTSFQLIRTFWKGVYGETDQAGQGNGQAAEQDNDQDHEQDDHAEAVGQSKVGQESCLCDSVTGQKVRGNEDEQHQGGGDGDGVVTNTLSGVQEDSPEDVHAGGGCSDDEHHAVVGDGFKEEFKKIVRSGRRRIVPDGKVQVLLSNFVVRRDSFQDLGGGKGQSVNTLETGNQKKRKGEQSASLAVKKLRL